MPPPAIHHVLVLDDDQIMRELLETLLSLEGWESFLTSSGQQALAALEANPGFDLVLTDLHMPELEGEYLAAALRSAMPTRSLLIGMSASPAEASAAAHLDAFLLKPFDPQTLQQAIETAAERRTAQKPAPPEPTPAQASPDAPPAGAVLDESIVQSLARMIPVPQLRQLYELTLGDVEKRHARMHASAANGDLDAVHREAHAMKGSCGMVGATELQSLAATLEGGTNLNSFALAEIPSACLRLRRMLDVKLHTV